MIRCCVSADTCSACPVSIESGAPRRRLALNGVRAGSEVLRTFMDGLGDAGGESSSSGKSAVKRPSVPVDSNAECSAFRKLGLKGD